MPEPPFQQLIDPQLVFSAVRTHNRQLKYSLEQLRRLLEEQLTAINAILAVLGGVSESEELVGDMTPGSAQLRTQGEGRTFVAAPFTPKEKVEPPLAEEAPMPETEEEQETEAVRDEAAPPSIERSGRPLAPPRQPTVARKPLKQKKKGKDKKRKPVTRIPESEQSSTGRTLRDQVLDILIEAHPNSMRIIDVFERMFPDMPTDTQDYRNSYKAVSDALGKGMLDGKWNRVGQGEYRALEEPQAGLP